MFAGVKSQIPSGFFALQYRWANLCDSACKDKYMARIIKFGFFQFA